MFNRRYIREKVVQAYYGFAQGGCENALSCQKNFLTGLDQTAQLYYYQLLFVVTLADYAAEQYKQAKERGVRSQKLLEGLRMMAENAAIEKLRRDSVLKTKTAEYRFDTKALRDLVKAVYESLFLNQGEGSVAGRMQADTSDEDPFLHHREFLRRLYKRKISDHPALRSYCEERSIYWEADYESACFWVYTTLSRMEEETETGIDEGWTVDDEVVDFGKTLLEKTLLHHDTYNRYVAESLENWRQERIGATESVLLCVAVSEMINFPSIPVKVSLNEYIELSKHFCSKDSAAFVNGVLNKVAGKLKEEKVIKKSGRGLIG